MHIIYEIGLWCTCLQKKQKNLNEDCLGRLGKYATRLAEARSFQAAGLRTIKGTALPTTTTSTPIFDNDGRLESVTVESRESQSWTVCVQVREGLQFVGTGNPGASWTSLS